ncbi:MAG TPA: hypothetical protein VKP30_19135, partial [Polyangiaceae bacterium]|nr:hypothetical protein [Polyangiaceae bacterium]
EHRERPIGTTPALLSSARLHVSFFGLCGPTTANRVCSSLTTEERRAGPFPCSKWVGAVSGDATAQQA